MQVLLSVLEALVDAPYDIESRTSLADGNFISTISNDTTYILAILQQQLAKQIGVLIDEQSLRVCHFYMFLYIYFALFSCRPLTAGGERRDKEKKRLTSENRQSHEAARLAAAVRTGTKDPSTRGTELRRSPFTLRKQRAE